MKLNILICIILVFIFSGCAEIEPPSPEKLLTPWSSIKDIGLGSTKDDVIDKWGEPDEINKIGVDELGTQKEEWVYFGRYKSAVVDYQYLSKTKYLYFEGNILVRRELKASPRSEK